MLHSVATFHDEVDGRYMTELRCRVK